MNHHPVARLTLLTAVALLLGACSGSGQGPAPLDQPANPTAGNSGGSTIPVSVTISSPAAGETMETPDESVSLGGTARSSAGIVSVSWRNDSGVEGDATGSESWETTPIPLEVGENTITVVAEDGAGVTATDTVVVTRESATTASITLSWEAPTEREDGSPLTDLSGYRIHYGRLSETYDHDIDIDNAGIVSYMVDGLSSGTWYFVVRAYDSAGLESEFSNEVSKELP